MKILETLAAFALTTPAWAQFHVISSVTPLVVQRGTTISMVGTLPPDTTVFWLPQEPRPTVSTQPYDCSKDTPKKTQLVASQPFTKDGETTFTALIPAMLPLGEYTICATFLGPNGSQSYRVPVLGDSGRLQVVDPPNAAPVQVTSVSRVIYQDGGHYKFSVLGNGFSRVGQDNAILLDGDQVDVCWDSASNCKTDLARGTVVNTHQLIIDLPANFAQKYPGSRTVQVRVGTDNASASEAAPKVALALIGRGAPPLIAAAVIAILIALVLVLLGMKRGSHSIAGKRMSLLSILLLDQSTDTYSLSRAQFYAWTGASIFGYTYLTIAWTYFQGRLEFAPVPQNLPGIILASAGTAVIAEGINSTKPKGAGSMQPSLSDFITTGEVVAPERLQFLVWTIVGVVTFLLLIMASDPATVTTLPSIPNDFLVLMGVSSAGYLGGRMARKGGPVVDGILATLGSLNLEIHGRFLSKNASFQIDGEDVTLDQVGSRENDDRLPEVVARDDSAQDPNIAKVLRLALRSPKLSWTTRKSHPMESKRTHTMTIVNPDGQKAEWMFSIAGPTAVLTASTSKDTAVNGTLIASRDDVVTFDASASRVSDGLTTFKWTVDGQVRQETGPKLSLRMISPLRQVTVEVIDAAGLSDSDSVTIKVAESRSPGPAGRS